MLVLAYFSKYYAFLPLVWCISNQGHYKCFSQKVLRTCLYGTIGLWQCKARGRSQWSQDEPVVPMGDFPPALPCLSWPVTNLQELKPSKISWQCSNCNSTEDWSLQCWTRCCCYTVLSSCYLQMFITSSSAVFSSQLTETLAVKYGNKPWDLLQASFGLVLKLSPLWNNSRKK